MALSFVGLGAVIYGLNEESRNPLPSALIMVAGAAVVALFVGVMSADVDGLMAAGATKAQAYAAGFSHTLYIDLGILAVAFVVSVIFARIMRKKRTGK